jgi:hypothetical protein
MLPVFASGAFIVLPVPSYETRYPLAQGGLGVEAEIASNILNIRIGHLDITGLHGKKFLLGLHLKAILNYRYKFEKLDGLIVSDIINPVRSETGAGILP